MENDWRVDVARDGEYLHGGFIMGEFCLTFNMSTCGVICIGVLSASLLVGPQTDSGYASRHRMRVRDTFV